MEHEFTYNGETIAIKLEKDGCVIGERKIPFESSPISPNSFHVIIGGESKVVSVAENNGSVFVHLDGHVIRLEKASDNQNHYAAGGDVFGAKDEVSTPMPGKIVKILVAVGDKVTVKQALVIVESMKMENKIVSPVDGEIKSIHFSDGDLVEPGKAIIKLIPAE